MRRGGGEKVSRGFALLPSYKKLYTANGSWQVFQLTVRLHKKSASDHSRRPGQHRNSNHNPIHGKGREPAPPHPTHEPGDRSVSDDEGDDEADGEDDPLVRRDLGNADGDFILASERLEERVQRGHGHGWDGEEEGELERGGARHSHQLSGGDRG